MTDGGWRAPTVFELVGPASAEDERGLLGLWTTGSPPPAEVVSFETPATAVEQTVLWRVDLPADHGEAAAQLAGAEATLARSSAAIAAAADRLTALVRAGATGLAFDVPSVEWELPPPEEELLLTLQGKGGAPVSFSPGEQRSEGVALGERLHGFVEQLLRAVVQYAWVETQVEGRLLGRTVVGWGGDVETVWRDGIGPEQVAQHERSLGLALASRTAWLRMFGLAAWGAVQLSAILTVPGGALLALPAVWRFVNQVQAEIARTVELV
jgi:hypothetical protein